MTEHLIFKGYFADFLGRARAVGSPLMVIYLYMGSSFRVASAKGIAPPSVFRRLAAMFSASSGKTTLWEGKIMYARTDFDAASHKNRGAGAQSRTGFDATL
jgi:hypothetical protein